MTSVRNGVWGERAQLLGPLLLLLFAGCVSPHSEPAGGNPRAPGAAGQSGTNGGALDGPSSAGASGGGSQNDGPSTDGPSTDAVGPISGGMSCDEQSCDMTAKDGCCPKACNAGTDPDCSASCGNGLLEPGEFCDPPGKCPTTCDNKGCTAFELQGSAAQCTARCVEKGQISACMDGDSCCPKGCNSGNDKDCLVVCDNKVKEAGETCDPLSSCPTTCPPDGCQLKKLVNQGTCTAECIPDVQQTKCQSGDGCCPSNCNNTNDSDCAPSCGNGVKETGETCDPCPTAASCQSQGCNVRTLQGSGCNVTCVTTTQTQCRGGDGCCPSGCDATSDSDCNAMCGNGVIEPGETCDPCPTAATCQSQGCNLRTLQGSGCNTRCVASTQTTCKNGDQCCPSGCNNKNDNDCPVVCGNNVVESGETCDGNCPTSCPDRNCRKFRLQGSAGSCTAQCVDNGHAGDPSEMNCSDGIDNDCDGLVDCADSDCNLGSCGTNKQCISKSCQQTCGLENMQSCPDGSCASGLFKYCDQFCYKRRANGADCDDDAFCVRTSVCDVTNSVCRAPAAGEMRGQFTSCPEAL